MNYWKQLNHVMKYFRPEEDPKAKLPRNFISGFLEVWRSSSGGIGDVVVADALYRVEIELKRHFQRHCYAADTRSC